MNKERHHPRVFRSATRAFVIGVLVLSLGGSWHLLQIFAWAKMIEERGPTMGWKEAIVSTVSGEEPCFRCEAIQAGRQLQEELPIAPDVNQVKPPALMAADSNHQISPPSGLLVPVSWTQSRTPLKSGDQPPNPPPQAA